MEELNSADKIKLALLGARLAQSALEFCNALYPVTLDMNMIRVARDIKSLDEAVQEIQAK